MYKEKQILGIIPARGGSKGIPKKNIVDLGGKPLIYYSIEQSINSKYLTDLVVSTDDKEIAQYLNSIEINVIDRPKNISLDKSPTEECLIHAIEVLYRKGKKYDYVVVLEPTSPFRKTSTIDNCIKKLIDFDLDSLFTVIKTYENIGIIDKNSKFKPLRENPARRRQDREPFYIESSTVYVANINYLLEKKSLVSQNWGSFIIEKEEAVDINTQTDLEYARFMFNKLKDKFDTKKD